MYKKYTTQNELLLNNLDSKHKNLIQKQLNLAISKIKFQTGIKLTVDVDPISFN